MLVDDVECFCRVVWVFDLLDEFLFLLGGLMGGVLNFVGVGWCWRKRCGKVKVVVEFFVVFVLFDQIVDYDVWCDMKGWVIGVCQCVVGDCLISVIDVDMCYGCKSVLVVIVGYKVYIVVIVGYGFIVVIRVMLVNVYDY